MNCVMYLIPKLFQADLWAWLSGKKAKSSRMEYSKHRIELFDCVEEIVSDLY